MSEGLIYQDAWHMFNFHLITMPTDSVSTQLQPDSCNYRLPNTFPLKGLRYRLPKYIPIFPIVKQENSLHFCMQYELGQMYWQHLCTEKT